MKAIDDASLSSELCSFRPRVPGQAQGADRTGLKMVNICHGFYPINPLHQGPTDGRVVELVSRVLHTQIPQGCITLCDLMTMGTQAGWRCEVCARHQFW